MKSFIVENVTFFFINSFCLVVMIALLLSRERKKPFVWCCMYVFILSKDDQAKGCCDICQIIVEYYSHSLPFLYAWRDLFWWFLMKLKSTSLFVSYLWFFLLNQKSKGDFVWNNGCHNDSKKKLLSNRKRKSFSLPFFTSLFE